MLAEAFENLECTGGGFYEFIQLLLILAELKTVPPLNSILMEKKFVNLKSLASSYSLRK